MEKLHAIGVVCPAGLRMQWLALTLQIEKRNGLLNEQCKKLAKRYEHDGFMNCVLKGQGNLMNYPEGLNTRRLSGDIDIWCVFLYRQYFYILLAHLSLACMRVIMLPLYTLPLHY